MEAKIVVYIARKEIKELSLFLDTVGLQEVRVMYKKFAVIKFYNSL
jgi:hypothetical protein